MKGKGKYVYTPLFTLQNFDNLSQHHETTFTNKTVQKYHKSHKITSRILQKMLLPSSTRQHMNTQSLN